MSLRARTAFALIFILSLGWLMPLPTAMGDPNHLQVQNDLATLFEELRWDQWLAQSFFAGSGYNITRVSLLVTDIGISDVLEVGLREDAGGFPGFFNLTGGSVDGPPSAGNWVDVDLDPWVELTAGATYWIVAYSGQMSGNGYAWGGSDNEFAYLDGEGMVSFDGFGWFPIGHDMTFRVYGFHQPSVTFSVTPSVMTLAPGDTVDFRVEFQNSGFGTSAALWVNVTLPGELRYMTDDAGDIGGNPCGSYCYKFQDVGPGTYVFNITARAEGGVPDGTQALTKFTFDVLDHNGVPLTSSNQDVTVQIVNAALTYGARVTPTSLPPGDDAVFRLNFTNSGQGTAAGVWVNVSLPSELQYLTDDAGAGGSPSGCCSFEFLNVVPGSYLFNVTATANGGVANGTVATTNITFQAADFGGASLNRTALDLDVTIGNAVLSLTVISSATTAQPGDILLLNATVRNLGAEAAVNLRITASVDANTTYLNSTPTGTFDPVNRDVEWNFGTLAAGEIQSVEWELEVPVGTPDGAFVRSFVCARAEDLAGSDLPRAEAQSVISVRAPAFAPALLLDRTWAERGNEVVASFYYNNTGSVTAPRAWVNATLGGHYEVVTLNPGLPYAPTADGFALELANVTVGLHLLEIRLLVVRGLDDGVAMQVQIQWTFTDGNGNPLPPEVVSSSVDLRAPAAVLSLESSESEVVGGSQFLLNLTLENVGRADAFGWLNLTLPAGTIFQGDNGLLNVTTQGDRVTWTLDGMPGATNLTLQIQLQAGGDSGLKSFHLTLNLTDGLGSGPASLFSNAVSIKFLAPPSLLANLPWWLLLLFPLVGMAALGAWAVRRRHGVGGDVSVEEVFVVDRGGTLLAHRSNSILQYKDEDLVVAMLTAIQRYIEDVFSYGMGDTIRSLDFGERRILIEDGASHFVAIVYRAEDAARLRDRARDLCAQIDERFGKIIDDWNGDTDEVRGIAALLPLIWRKRSTQGSE